MPRKSAPRRAVIVRYHLPDGTRCRKGAPGAIRAVTESESYYARIRRKWVPLGTSDLGKAWTELRRLQRREKDREAGIIDDHQEQAARPIADHIREWLQSVRDKGTSQEQVDTLKARVEKVAELAGWRRVADLSADSLLRALAQLQQGDGGISAQTRNHYARHCKQFARWCCRTRPRRLAENPLDIVGMVGVEADRRHDRRPPTEEEVALLFEHLHGEMVAVRKDMTGPQRALGYRVSMATGFRAKELRSLERRGFDLDGGTVTCRAAYDKRRRLVTQQLPAWLVEELRAWFDAGGECWGQFPVTYPGRLLKADLAAARAAWIAEATDAAERTRREKSDTLRYEIEGPDGPLFLDFHSLRYWYCTWAANLPGISPRTLMALCRHSTPTLTLKTYAKARTSDLREAVEQMPAPPERPVPPQPADPGGPPV